MKSLRDFLYDLLKGRHIERWRHFEKFTTLERLRIILYVVNHGNHVRVREIISGLIDAGYSRSPETLARIIRYMRADRFLQEDSEGFLSVENPNQLRFIIKESRGSLKDSWFLIALAVSLSSCVINFVEHGFGTIEFFLLLITALVFCRVVDDALHETSW